MRSSRLARVGGERLDVGGQPTVDDDDPFHQVLRIPAPSGDKWKVRPKTTAADAGASRLPMVASASSAADPPSASPGPLAPPPANTTYRETSEFATVNDGKGTFHFMSKNRASYEGAALRSNAVALDNGMAMALAVVDTFMASVTTSSGDTVATLSAPPTPSEPEAGTGAAQAQAMQYENDWLSKVGEVQEALKLKYATLAELGDPAGGAAKAAALGVGFLTPEGWKKCQHALSAAAYTHKHCDLVTGELSQQVGVASLEQVRRRRHSFRPLIR